MDQERLYQISKDVVAPVLYQYVEWILTEAHKRNIPVLYFQARDGFVLLEIAKKLCTAKNYPIQCRYLYGSRMAFRVPSYHLIGDKAYDLIFLDDGDWTIASVFRRTCLTDVQQHIIMDILHFTDGDLYRKIGKDEWAYLKQKFQEDEMIRQIIMEESLSRYNHAIGYLRQEGLFLHSSIGIVDSGWAGTMQYSLCHLLKHAGYTGMVTGFYFGLIGEPPVLENGVYLSWYFSKTSTPWRKLCFNILLFECMLSAPHGMTMSYSLTNGKYQAVLGPPPTGKTLQAIHIQYTGITDGVCQILSQNKLSRRQAAYALRKFRALMVHPAKEDVYAYMKFQFSSDIAEFNMQPLVAPDQADTFSEHMFIYRLKRKLTGTTISDVKNYKWIYGALAFVDSRMRKEWYWINIFAYDVYAYLYSRVTAKRG